jgi:hypothetical protein
VGRHIVTGPRGEVLTDLFETREGRAEDELQSVISAVEQGRTDRGGNLLGAFNIGYVVLQRGPGAYRWLSQADLAVERNNPEEQYLLLSNQETLSRAGIYEEVPSIVSAIDERDPSNIAAALPPSRENAEQVTSSRYQAELESGGGIVFLAETYDERWEAQMAGTQLERTDAGWGNAFVLPGTDGRLTVRFPRSTAQLIWLLVLALAWAVTVGAAFSRSQGHKARAR